MAKKIQKKTSKKTTSKKSLGSTVVVGIGASAGGTRALKEFFTAAGDSKLKQAKNIVFIVIQHLDDSGKNLALDSLKRMTKLPVQELKTGMVLTPQRVYAVPPHMLVQFKDGLVKMTNVRTTAQKLGVIDHLFTALGAHYHECAVGIILSGEASDGAAGVRDINEAGGLTLAQTPESSEHRSMPDSAISTGAVDHVLSPKQIWQEVASYSDYIEHVGSKSEREAMKDQITSALTSICDILHKNTKHDFKHYKTSTLLRRIQRRMQVLQLPSVNDYLDLLNKNTQEVDILFKELLINVTSFFRDKEAFEVLKEEVLKKIIEQAKPNQKVRVWIAACSTGEEAYSVGIMIRELMEKMAKPPEVQIIATDIDDAALNVGRRGSYPATIAEHVSAERLSKYFVKRSGRYHVSKDLREMCLFSVHNLITDPPFSQLDLISCRNLLIYLGPHLQKKLFPVFHYALRSGGYLFLGTSETLTSHRELFKPVNTKHRIAQRKQTAIKLPSISTSVQNYLSHFQENEKVSEADLGLISQRIALDEMPLRYSVVNDEGQILSSSAGISKYVQFTEGAFQNNIVKLVNANLRAALRSAFATAKKEKRKITNDTCTIKLENTVERTCVIVQPMPQLGDLSELYWIAFQNMGTVHGKEDRVSRPATDEDVEIIDQLERELSLARQELDKSVQDLEASNEELKSSNEELLSMNEELQSANEELETSKEDVQNSNDALQRANTDLENLLASTQIATLFLDDMYRIRGFTPAIQEIYNIQMTDVGRMLSDFTSRSKTMAEYPDPETLTHDVQNESQLLLPDGRIFLRRILPYRTPEDTRDGIVVTFIDVTELRSSEGRFLKLANEVPMITWTAKANGDVEFFNSRWYEYTGQDRHNAQGWGWSSVVHPDDMDRTMATWNQSINTGVDYKVEYRLRRHDGVYRWHNGSGVAFRNEAGIITNWFGTCVDIHETKEKADLLEESGRSLRTIVEAVPQYIWRATPDGKADYASERFCKFVGYPLPKVLGNGWIDLIYPEDRERVARDWAAAREAKASVKIDFRIHRGGSPEYHWVRSEGVPYFDTAGNVQNYYGTWTDIHDQHILQAQIKAEARRTAAAHEELRDFFMNAPEPMVTFKGPEHVFHLVNPPYVEFVGQDPTGLKIRDAFSYEEAGIFFELLDKVYKTGQPYVGKELPFERRLKNGVTEHRWINVGYYPARDGEGKITGLSAYVHDVTDQVEARRMIESAKLAVDNERANFQNLFKQTPEMVCILKGREQLFVFVNEAHVRVLGFNATGMTLKQAQPESLEVHGILDDVFMTGKTAELNEIPVTVGSSLRYFNLTYAATRDMDGKIDGVMILGTEVTARKNIEEDLQKAKQAAENANESKTRFLANMSHEIRTPLSAIAGFSDLLRSRMNEDEEANSYIDRISRNSVRLGRLIDELLDLSKIEADKLEIEKAAIDADALIEDVQSAMMLRAQEKGLRLNFTWASAKPPSLVTDPVRLSQILVNIVGNAVKFTEKGAVNVELASTGKKFTARVSDTGIGLTQEQQARIFEPFMQADASVTRKYGGTGLGLALSKRLAHLLGGDLRLEKSVPGEGSTFIIEVATDISQIHEKKDDAESTDPGPTALKGKSVLVVDDSPDNRLIVAMYLRGIGATIGEASNGAEGVKMAMEGNFDVVLMDIQMPVMDGYQAMQKLTELKYKKPVVALTAHAFKEERDRCLSAGFTSYLTKPINRANLLKGVCEWVRV